MAKAITDMTTQQIRDRLAELDTQDAEHAARDFDSELSSALMNGSDVDALEAQQLDAERQARRLRVERQALTAALPEAAKREVQPELDKMATRHAEAATEAAETAQQIEEHWQELRALIESWTAARVESVELTREAVGLARQVDLPAPQLGGFVDHALVQTAVEMRERGRRMAAAAADGTEGQSHALR